MLKEQNSVGALKFLVTKLASSVDCQVI